MGKFNYRSSAGMGLTSPGLPLKQTRSMAHNPGPGKYEVLSSVKPQPISTKRSARRFRFGTSAARADLGNKTARDANFNGPRSGMAEQPTSQHRSAPSFGFGTASRPGPADLMPL